MKAVIQRVSRADITINSSVNREIGAGLVVLLGVMEGDAEPQAEFLAKKIAQLRIFTDENDKLNRSLVDIGGDMLIVSNFTLAADCKKGKRPSFDKAAKPPLAQELYDRFVDCVRALPIGDVQTGEFGADMQVALVNDGPITIVIDTAAIGK